MTETQGRQTDAPSQRPTLASVEAAIGASSAVISFTTELGEEIVAPIPTAIFYTQAGYAEQCEALERHLESRGLQKESLSVTQGMNSRTDFQRESLIDIAREMDPGIEIPESTRKGAINGHITFRALERAIELKIAENNPRIREIAEAISRGETTYHIQSRVETGLTERPIQLAAFRINGLTESERHGLVIKYLEQQLLNGRTAIEIGRQTGIELDIRKEDSFIEREAKLLDFSFRNKGKAETEARQEAMGPNTLMGSLREWLNQNKTTVYRSDLILFFQEFAHLDDHEICLLEAVLSPQLLSQTDQLTVKAFARECIQKMEDKQEAARVLLDITWRLEPPPRHPQQDSSTPLPEETAETTAHRAVVEILCTIATDLREEVLKANPNLEQPTPIEEGIAKQRSTIRTLALAVLLLAIGAGVGANLDRIKTLFQNTEPSVSRVSNGESQPMIGTLWDASTDAQADDSTAGPDPVSLGMIMEEARIQLKDATTTSEDSQPQGGTLGIAMEEARKREDVASVPAPVPRPDEVKPQEAPKPPTAKEIKTSSVPVVVKTIQFGPKAGQTEIDLNQSKKAWEALGWNLSTSMDTATRAKTLILTHQDGRVITFPETTPVTTDQTTLSVQVTK